MDYKYLEDTLTVTVSQSLHANLHMDKRVTIRVLNGIISKSIVSEKNIMNCGDTCIEENPGVLDQCYSNNNFVTTAVLGVRNYVLLETRLREFNRTAVDVGLVSETWTLNA